METPTHGKDKFLMFRLEAEKNSKSGLKLALQTTHTIKEKAKASTTATKDGTIATSGALETEIDFEAIASATELVDMLHFAVKNNLPIDVWEIDVSKPKDSTGKYWSQFGTGFLSDWETPADVEKDTTIKSTVTINGKLVGGYATVPPEQEAVMNIFFRDTVVGAKDEAPVPDYVIDDGTNTSEEQKTKSLSK